jgi:glycosyltransferase involved in cell wall biosynthesis
VEHACIVSIVTVIGRGCAVEDIDLVEALRTLHRNSAGLGYDIELVIANNGATQESLDAMRQLASELPNLHFYTLQKPVDYAVARLASLEAAVGDWIAFVDLGVDPSEMLGPLLREAFQGNDVVFAGNRTSTTERSFAERLLSPVYHRLFAFFHGFDLQQGAPAFRLISRNVANAISQNDFPLVALDLIPAHGGYPTRTLEYSGEISKGRISPLPEKFRERWRALIGISGAPLRFANLVCAFGAVANLAYSCYVILIYIFKPDVAPGWTTLSLQAAGMFFLISVVLWLLSEYLLLMFDRAARRNVYRIASEFSSNVQTRRARLNVDVER